MDIFPLGRIKIVIWAGKKCSKNCATIKPCRETCTCDTCHTTSVMNNRVGWPTFSSEIQKESICSASSLTSRFLFTLKSSLSPTEMVWAMVWPKGDICERRNWVSPCCWAHTGNRTLNFACLPIQRRKPSHRGATLCQGELPCQLEQMPVS